MVPKEETTITKNKKPALSVILYVLTDKLGLGPERRAFRF